METLPSTPEGKEVQGQGATVLHPQDVHGRVLSLETNAAREVIAAMPEQSPKEGGAVEWGVPGNKARALHIAALLGHHFNPKCPSCESDLYYVIKNAAK